MIKHISIKLLKNSYHLIGFIIISVSSFSVIAQNSDSLMKQKKSFLKTKVLELNGYDGPYIVNDTLYRVNSQNDLIIKETFARDSVVIKVNNDYYDQFHLDLSSKKLIPKSIYPSSDNITVISDIEGKYNAFASFLYANKIIDKEHNWVYGDGHLVLVGDFVDRGKNVTQVLWLIYKLEHQAKKQGGHVHFILGNHEILNFQGHHKYNRGKYIKVAQEISGADNKRDAVKYLYSNRSELGEWLATKNVIEKIGNYLFVHAGLSPDIIDYKLNLDHINKLVRSQFDGAIEHKNDTINYLYGSKGPFWYRGLVSSQIKYPKIRENQLDDILRYYNANKVIVGHTVVKNISTDFDGKVIRIDVIHGKNKYSGKTKGLLIENGCEYIIDDKGNKSELKY